MMIHSVAEASRLQNHLLPPGDAPMKNGAIERWQVTNDPLVVIERQRYLNDLQDNRKSDRLSNGDTRVAELRNFVRGLEVELALAAKEGAL